MFLENPYGDINGKFLSPVVRLITCNEDTQQEIYPQYGMTKCEDQDHRSGAWVLSLAESTMLAFLVV